MRFKVTMKNPDALHDAIADAVREEVSGLVGLDTDECREVAELRQEKAQDAAAKWFRYGEYLTVEIDTEAGTATVCPAGS